MDDHNNMDDSREQSNTHGPRLSKSTSDAVDRLLEHGMTEPGSEPGSEPADRETEAVRNGSVDSQGGASNSFRSVPSSCDYSGR